ncbi:ADP-heptose--lipooligosaccharide heptosyltransferase II [invertebrate metagenome]|uniref:ADP-heptose--lipooligosaccharide heptosyltransferase II n=1 Tax=invertebrate metagenome TaxID=1711999 RepID=A0A484H6T5_9ZZZZ
MLFHHPMSVSQDHLKIQTEFSYVSMCLMKILFITSTRIGDAVLSTGLLDYLVRVHPEARVTVVCGSSAAPLFSAMPSLEQIIAVTKGRYASHWIPLWAHCIRTRWDIVVDLRRSVLPWLLLAGKRHRLGSNRMLVHRVRQIADVLALPVPPAPRLWITARHHQAADRLLPSQGPPVLGIGPTANWHAKIWRVTNFVALIDRLTGKDGILPAARVAVFGAHDERDNIQPILEYLTSDRCIDLVGTVDLLTAYACLQRCVFYIGNDSGLMHLAAAANIPTLGLFGPSQDRHYAPWGQKGAVVRAVVPSLRALRSKDGRTSSDTLMDSLTVEMAETAARRLWAESQDGKQQ